MLPLTYAGFSGKRKKPACDKSPERVGLAIVLTGVSNELGWAQQRVAIARALVNSRRFCWQMNQPAHWTVKRAWRSWSCSKPG